MSWKRFLPLRFIISRAARSQGFLDPLELMARLRSLAQPSEVGEPIELLRAGVVFHARGLINSKVIQQNLDWVWPHWIERQYDPRDDAFMPRAFSVTHVNLTNRNWTGIGWPDLDEIPIVDPRGLLTPFLDSWSIDAWLFTDDGRCLLPSRADRFHQQQTFVDSPAVVTETRGEGLRLTTSARVESRDGKLHCALDVTADADAAGRLVIALRPANPEGVSFIHDVELDRKTNTWQVDKRRRVVFGEPPQRHVTSTYNDGDVYLQLDDLPDNDSDHCRVGLLTAAAVFPLSGDGDKSLTLRIPLEDGDAVPEPGWSGLTETACELDCPEPLYNYLYQVAVHSLILHSPREVYPGPYTYKRFWFRDAAFILNAMLSLGFTDRVERALHEFPKRQTALGFFRSQEGEWDSNGEVLWILERFRDLTGSLPSGQWEPLIQKAASWIVHKRLSDNSNALHAGLLPAGFSAEHLGPNDYYYWDNFWSLAGLRAADRLLDGGFDRKRLQFRETADRLEAAISNSLEQCRTRLQRPGMPASPYRRLDAGAIGSLAVAYPLQLWDADDSRVTDCVEYLLDKCFVDNAFFQDMIHSGLNAYLTLHVAQAMLRNGDSRYLTLMDSVAELASPTGQWPEAIHPKTRGGCMGDGHHVWASAEWVMMIRNCFVREEGDGLVLCGGVPSRWLREERPVTFGPAPTPFGNVSLALKKTSGDECELKIDGEWSKIPGEITVRLPDYEVCRIAPDIGSVRLRSRVG